MSFFGFESNDLERDKRRVLEGGSHETEDLAVYTWGEEGYDGLGEALQEGGDELNDETFGNSGVIGLSHLLYVVGDEISQHLFHKAKTLISLSQLCLPTSVRQSLLPTASERAQSIHRP